MSRFSRLEFGRNATGELHKEIVKDEEFYFNEAKAAFESGQFDGALRSFAKVLEFNPKNTHAWIGQVRALIELGEHFEAKVWADKALETFDDDPELLAAKAVALARFGDTKAAIAFSDASMERQGETPYLWVARGDVLLARGEARAEYCFQRAMVLAPGDWVLRWLISRAHAFYNRFSLSLRYAEEALHMNSTSAAIWLQLGQCQLALGMTIPAESSFHQVQQLDPRSEAAEAGLAQIAGVGFLSRLRGAILQLFHQ